MLGEDTQRLAVLQGGHEQRRAGALAAGQCQNLLITLHSHRLEHCPRIHSLPARMLLTCPTVTAADDTLLPNRMPEGRPVNRHAVQQLSEGIVYEGGDNVLDRSGANAHRCRAIWACEVAKAL